MLQYLQDRVVFYLRWTERLFHLFSDILLRLCYGYVIALGRGHLLSVKSVKNGDMNTDRGGIVFRWQILTSQHMDLPLINSAKGSINTKHGNISHLHNGVYHL